MAGGTTHSACLSLSAAKEVHGLAPMEMADTPASSVRSCRRKATGPLAGRTAVTATVRVVEYTTVVGAGVPG